MKAASSVSSCRMEATRLRPAAIRSRLTYADLPAGLRGLGIAFVLTGLMSLGFASFAQMAAAR